MPNLLTDLQKLKALNAGEWACLGSALVLLPLLRIGLRLMSFQTVFRVLERSSEMTQRARSGAPRTILNDEAIAGIVRMVNVAADRGPVPANCLPRSLATWWLLRRRGLDCELRLGVKPRDADIQAHAWVECEGNVLNDEADTNRVYTAFERLPVHQGKQPR